MPGGWISWYLGPGGWVPWGKGGVAPTDMGWTGLQASPGGETKLLGKVPLAGNSDSPRGKPRLSPAVKKRPRGRRQGCAWVENPCFPQGKSLFLQCFLEFPSGASLEHRCLVGAACGLLWLCFLCMLLSHHGGSPFHPCQEKKDDKPWCCWCAHRARIVPRYDTRSPIRLCEGSCQAQHCGAVVGRRLESPHCLLRGDKAMLFVSRGESNECTFTSTDLLTRIKRSLYPGPCGYSDTAVPGGLRDLAGTNKSR